MEMYEQLQGTLSTGKTWWILRALINPDVTKTMKQHKLQALTKELEYDLDKLVRSIRHTSQHLDSHNRLRIRACQMKTNEKFDMTELKRTLSH